MPRGRGAQRVVISHSLSPAVTKVPWIPFQGQVWSRRGRARGLVWGRGRIPSHVCLAGVTGHTRQHCPRGGSPCDAGPGKGLPLAVSPISPSIMTADNLSVFWPREVTKCHRRLLGQGARGSLGFCETRRQEGGRDELCHPSSIRGGVPNTRFGITEGQRQLRGRGGCHVLRVTEKVLPTGNADKQDKGRGGPAGASLHEGDPSRGGHITSFTGMTDPRLPPSQRLTLREVISQRRVEGPGSARVLGEAGAELGR